MIIAEITSALITGVIALVAGAAGTYVFVRFSSKNKADSAENEIRVKLEAANREADNILKAAKLDAAEAVIQKKEEFTAEMNQSQNQLRDKERRLTKREDTLDRETDLLRQSEKQLKESEKDLVRKKENLDVKNKDLSSVITQQKNQLLKISSMDVQSAKELLLKRLEDECEHEMNSVVLRKSEETKEIAEEKGREIISTAIQRYAAEQTCEVSVSMVDIPSDDMKGRVIGREGRNIRAFEKATGVDVIVDDTPGIIIVSGFNPLRRELARQSMAKLIQDSPWKRE